MAKRLGPARTVEPRAVDFKTPAKQIAQARIDMAENEPFWYDSENCGLSERSHTMGERGLFGKVSTD